MVSFTVCNCLTRVETDGMDEEQATTGALETDQSERRRGRRLADKASPSHSWRTSFGRRSHFDRERARYDAASYQLKTR